MEVGSPRLFFALALPPDLQKRLGSWQQAQAPARWPRPEGLHVTLAFLGERPAAALSSLEGLGASVAARHGAFTLRTAGLGGFPNATRARVLWLGLAPSPALEALSALAGDLRGALTAAGEAFDPKPFRAHLTLARFRPPQALAGFTAPPPAAFQARAITLFESRPAGTYIPLRAWSLREV